MENPIQQVFYFIYNNFSHELKQILTDIFKYYKAIYNLPYIHLDFTSEEDEASFYGIETKTIYLNYLSILRHSSDKITAKRWNNIQNFTLQNIWTLLHEIKHAIQFLKENYIIEDYQAQVNFISNMYLTTEEKGKHYADIKAEKESDNFANTEIEQWRIKYDL